MKPPSPEECIAMQLRFDTPEKRASLEDGMMAKIDTIKDRNVRYHWRSMMRDSLRTTWMHKPPKPHRLANVKPLINTNRAYETVCMIDDAVLILGGKVSKKISDAVAILKTAVSSLNTGKSEEAFGDIAQLIFSEVAKMNPSIADQNAMRELDNLLDAEFGITTGLGLFAEYREYKDKLKLEKAP